MKQYLKSIILLILGLSFFHLFSTLQVYLSNTELLTILTSAKTAGYLLMPNELIMSKLKGIPVALAGGVFFTLSVGTLTVLLSFLSVFFFRKRTDKNYKLAAIVLFYIIFIFLLNMNGICPVETFSFVLTPLFVFFLYRRLFANENERPTVVGLAVLAVHFVPVVILAGLLLVFSSGASGKIFTDFRDNFLMSNNAGMAINEFYYDYTLYPARVFKPYRQRIPKLCKITSDELSGDLRRIEYRLLQNDYLVAGNDAETDIEIVKEKNGLKLVHKGKTIIETSVNAFISQSGKILNDFSQKTDKYGFYRQITAVSLKTGFPLFMYILMHFVFFAAFSPLITLVKKRAAVPYFASAACLLVGLAAFGFLSLAESFDVTKGTLPEVFKSKNVKERIAGLRYVAEKKLDLANYTDYDTSFSDNNIPEKYWFARSIGYSSDSASYKTLLRLLDDANQNVVCQALYSLGVKQKKEAVPVIINLIRKSENWYVQWYAYRALKRLGWKQKK